MENESQFVQETLSNSQSCGNSYLMTENSYEQYIINQGQSTEVYDLHYSFSTQWENNENVDSNEEMR